MKNTMGLRKSSLITIALHFTKLGRYLGTTTTPSGSRAVSAVIKQPFSNLLRRFVPLFTFTRQEFKLNYFQNPNISLIIHVIYYVLTVI